MLRPSSRAFLRRELECVPHLCRCVTQKRSVRLGNREHTRDRLVPEPRRRLRGRQPSGQYLTRGIGYLRRQRLQLAIPSGRRHGRTGQRVDIGVVRAEPHDRGRHSNERQASSRHDRRDTGVTRGGCTGHLTMEIWLVCCGPYAEQIAPPAPIPRPPIYIP